MPDTVSKTRQQSDRSELQDLETYIEELENFVDVPLALCNQDLLITDTNEAFLSRFAISQSDVLGTKLLDLLNDADTKTQITEHTHNSFSDIWEGSVRMSINGRDYSGILRLKGWCDASDNPRGLLVQLAQADANPQDAIPKPDSQYLHEYDDNRLKEVEKILDEVKEQQMRTQSIIYNITDGLLFLDADNVVKMVNPSAISMLEVDSGNLMGRKLSEIHGEELIDQLQGLLESKKDLRREEVSIGTRSYFEVTTVHVGTEKETSQTVVILHDISEKRKIEEMKLEFASVAAHQMRTPLSSIRWSFEILNKKLEDSELKKAAKRGYRSVRQVLEVVDQLLNVDRLEQGRSAYSFGPVDIIQLLDETADSAKQSHSVIDQANIDFKKPRDHMPKVRGDDGKLQIVFKNLIDNALKYTDSDDEVKIRVNMNVTDGYAGDSVLVTVADSGIGIPESAQNKIFTKFFRADNATDTETEGTGVGLFITKQIVEAHNGKIWFESDTGEGTKFFVQLPLARES